MRDKSHESAQLSDEVFKRQRVEVSSLGLNQLITWIQEEEIIAAGVQLRLLEHPTVSVREALARKDKLLPQVSIELINTSNRRILSALGANPDLSSELLDQLLLSASLSVLENLSYKAPSLTKSQRDFFRTHEVEVIRQNFAGRVDLTEEDTLLMFRSEGLRIQKTLMHTISLTSDLFDEVLQSGNEDLLGFVARRNDLSEELQLKLLDKAPKSARNGLAWKKALSLKVLDKIFEGDIDSIARGISHAKNLSEAHAIKILESSDVVAHANVARWADISSEILSSVLQGEYGQYAKIAAYSHPKAPQDLLDKGFETGDLQVLMELARNQNLSKELKAKMVLLDNEKVVASISWNESFELSLDSSMALVRARDANHRKGIPAFMEEMKESVDKSAWEALSPSWSGTFRELIETCKVLGAEVSA